GAGHALPTRDDERALGEAIAWIGRPLVESNGCEARREARERRSRHRLSAIEGKPPRRQVEPRRLLVGDLLRAIIISEVRTAADGRLVAGDRGQPSRWALEERDR